MTQINDQIASSCPLCQHQIALYVGQKTAAGHSHDYHKCLSCELVYAIELPTAEMFAEAYKGGFTVRNVNRKTLKLAPMLGYLRLKRFLTGKKKPIKFLDIGSNAGYFSEAARRLGCESHGIELNQEAVALAKQKYPECHFYSQTLESFSEKGLKFDVIYCSEVIEHVTDIHSFTQAMRSLAHQGTLLFLTTPDASHFKVPKKLIDWHEIIAVEHLRLFNKKNMAMLLKQHGFKINFSYPMLRANQRHFCKPVAKKDEL